MNKKIALALALTGALGLSPLALAEPVVYTLHTVADGKLGALSFTEAPITITYTGDTRHVQTATVNGGIVYTNASGSATVSVTQGFKTVSANFAPGEIYVRYDTQLGTVGFGSAISPTYPITLGCGNADCTAGEWGANVDGWDWLNGQRTGTATAQADVAANPWDQVYSSPAALALPANLSRSTLLTGGTHTCAVPYLTDANGYLLTCPSAAPRGLRTDHGAFYLQDSIGYPSDYYDNVAVLRVETASGH